MQPGWASYLVLLLHIPCALGLSYFIVHYSYVYAAAPVIVCVLLAPSRGGFLFHFFINFHSSFVLLFSFQSQLYLFLFFFSSPYSYYFACLIIFFLILFFTFMPTLTPTCSCSTSPLPPPSPSSPSSASSASPQICFF